MRKVKIENTKFLDLDITSYVMEPKNPIGIAFLYTGMPQEYTRTYWFYQQLSSGLAKLGYRTVRFDYPGTGNSGGSFEDFTFEDWISVQSVLD